MSKSKSTPSVDKTEKQLAEIKQLNQELIQKLNTVQNLPRLEDADVFTLAAELHRRFGIYTVFTNLEPDTEDINPMTATEFTRYEHGLAYQQFKRSRNVIDERDYGKDHEQKQVINQQHQAVRSQGFSRPDLPTLQQEVPRTESANIDRASYEYRTSVHGEQAQVAGEAIQVPKEIRQDDSQAGRERYRAAVAAQRREADERAADYARRTVEPAYDEGLSNEAIARSAVDEPEPTTPVKEGSDFVGGTNATTKTVLEGLGIGDEPIKENNIFGQQVRP